MEEFLSHKLHQRESSGLLRTLPQKGTGIDFCSNDYLGLARSAELTANISTRIGQTRENNGATGSRLLTGNSQRHLNTEIFLAAIFGVESTLLFSSGYTANVALLSSIPQRGDTILYDDRSHASIKDGARLSHAKIKKFKHNDAEDLSRMLSQSEGHLFVVVESVYSMDGDHCDFKSIISVTKEHQAHLIVDEAHSTGIYGEKGEGLLNTLNLGSDVFARVFTFGKAMGIHGAAIAGSQTLVDYLINFSRPFIYTTASPFSHLVAVEEAFKFLIAHPTLRDKLHKNIAYFNNYLNETGLDNNHFLVSDSPIQGLIIPGNSACRALSVELKSKGFEVLPILSPTVPKGQERIRICLHSYNSQEEIKGLLNTIIDYI